MRRSWFSFAPLLVCCVLSFTPSSALAQQPAAAPAAKPAPKSPAATASATIAGKTISIVYSSPRVNGRAGQIFSKDGLIGKDGTYPIWRAGANSATVLHTDADLTLGAESVAVPKGDYSLWVDISDANNWVLIVNTQHGQWGRTYDPKLDLVHVKMATSNSAAPLESLTYTVTDLGGGKGSITLAWENKSAMVTFTAN